MVLQLIPEAFCRVGDVLIWNEFNGDGLQKSGRAIR